MARRVTGPSHPPGSPGLYQHSSRSLYPTFLTLPETVKLQAYWAWNGFVDGCRWDIVVRTASSDPEIRSNVLKSLLLNSLSLTSIYVFDLLLHPLVRDHPSWFHRNVGWFYRVLWLMPVIGVSFWLNSSWCNLIAKRTFVLQHGSRASQQQPMTYTGLLTMLATSAYRGIMVLTSVVVSFALVSIPYIGSPVSFAFMCWVDAYYCFEFIWVARGLSLARRVRHLEERWAYYFAFGLPSAALCTWGSSLANVALFALIFPAFIIMAMHARPLPQDPYNPLPQSDDTIRYPSPYLPIRMPVFALVIWLNDWVVRLLSVGTRTPSARSGHRRVPSDGGSEQVEEGASIEMDGMSADTRIPRDMGAGTTDGRRYRVMRTGNQARRKAD